MKTHVNKTQDSTARSVANTGSISQSRSGSTFQFVDNRPDAIQMQKLQEMANKSPQVRQLRALKKMINSHANQSNIIQAQFTPQTRRHLGHDDPATNWLDEIIGNVVIERSSNMRYTKTDGDGVGTIKHHVPYNWIVKNIADKYVIGHKRHTVISNIVSILESLRLDFPGSYPQNAADFDAVIRDSVDLICDWEENLFRHSDSSGDGGGYLIDTPNDAVVLARVQSAALALGDLANPSL